MATVISKGPVQTYSRKADRISQQIARANSDPKLVDDLASAIRSQANEISDFLIKRSASTGRYATMKDSSKKR